MVAWNPGEDLYCIYSFEKFFHDHEKIAGRDRKFLARVRWGLRILFLLTVTCLIFPVFNLIFIVLLQQIDPNHNLWTTLPCKSLNEANSILWGSPDQCL